MLLIRDEQLSALLGVRQKEYERRLAAHLRKYFSETCAELGEGGLRDAVRYGIQRAKSYGIDAERDVVKYLNLMFVFGRDFDTDPRFPWAASMLHSTDYGPTLRINQVYSDAKTKIAEGPGFFSGSEERKG
jgi:hypothetical protein